MTNFRQREIVLSQCRSEKWRGLVATDVTAQGSSTKMSGSSVYVLSHLLPTVNRVTASSCTTRLGAKRFWSIQRVQYSRRVEGIPQVRIWFWMMVTVMRAFVFGSWCFCFFFYCVQELGLSVYLSLLKDQQQDSRVPLGKPWWQQASLPDQVRLFW